MYVSICYVHGYILKLMNMLFSLLHEEMIYFIPKNIPIINIPIVINILLYNLM